MAIRHHVFSRRLYSLSLAAGAGTLLCRLSALHGPPLVLVNASPSEPPGLYTRTFETPAVGRIIAFGLPAAGDAYVDAAMPYLRQRPLLKAVAAGPGDQVCEGPTRLMINGRERAPVVARDHAGRLLPHWQGCRALRSDELFVFSARAPNSFDSRYFGTVLQASVLGVYRLAAPFTPGAA